MEKGCVTKKQIIINLYKDKFIDERILLNLLNSKFGKSEIKQINKTFRRYFKRCNHCI